ncbi:unnamed protein product [Periconia digitata]|uniref:Uncharacterized protein n=1 Tax=Periconia digitata TaxID=1303443 RepID=A0A9W4UNJ1_9PLEO|nr:unnamed protein product [Periconia digitata]
MLFLKGIILSLLSASVHGFQVYQNVEYDFGMMLARGEAMLEKRQGYYPTTRLCGKGKTCPEACGAGTEECPAASSGLYCYEPSRSRCCSDGSGNSCRIGYYCTTDGKTTPRTYCCPDNSNLADCAAAYSLTISLIRASSTFVQSSSTVRSSVVTTRSSTVISSESSVVVPTGTVSIPTIVVPSFSSASLPTGRTTGVVPTNGSVTTSAPVQFTAAAAAKVTGMGVGVLAGVVGVAGFL